MTRSDLATASDDDIRAFVRTHPHPHGLAEDEAVAALIEEARAIREDP